MAGSMTEGCDATSIRSRIGDVDPIKLLSGRQVGIRDRDLRAVGGGTTGTGERLPETGADVGAEGGSVRATGGPRAKVDRKLAARTDHARHAHDEYRRR